MPSGRTVAVAALLVVTVALGACSASPTTSFDPNGPCTADGAAPGAYPDLEARIPTTLEGQGPGRLDSEVRFAGGTWDLTGDAAVVLAVFQAGGLTADRIAEFYTTSARTADRTTIVGESTPAVGGRPGHRLDTRTSDRSQSIVVWPSADPDIVDVVISNELPDAKIQAAVDAFGGR
jgi:hypothetical protein